MSRNGVLLAAAFCLALFLPASSSAKVVSYYYQPHLMASAEDASNRLQFLSPHFAPGNASGGTIPATTTVTLNKVEASTLGLNVYFTESGTENKPQGLLGLTSITVPFRDNTVITIVYAHIDSFEILNSTRDTTATPWCVVPMSSGSENNVLCVPSRDDAQQVADALATLAEAFGDDIHSNAGVTLEMPTDKELRKHPEKAGCQITDVQAEGPAAQVGIQAGDTLRTVNGTACTPKVLSAALAEAVAKPDGGIVHAEILRKDKPMMLDLHYPHFEVNAAALRQQVASSPRQHELPPGIVPTSATAPAAPAFHLGISGRALTDADLPALGLAKPQGVLVTNVEKGSIADQMQMQSGDVILQMNGADVTDSAAFAQSVRSGAAKTFKVWRKGQTLDLAVSQSM